MTPRIVVSSPGLAWLLLAACASSPPPTPALTSSAPAVKENAAVPQLPTCATGADLARLDGQRVVVVGTYRKRMSAKKMGQPATLFYGFVQIELAGHATDYDSTARDGAPAMVRLGTDKRSDDEIAQLTDKPVRVEGKLVVRPPVEPNVATTLPVPTLFDVAAISPQ